MSVTIYDIAERAGVSIATVSRVLNNHARVAAPTRERVLAIAQELGYQPHASAQSLARRKPHLLSAVIPMIGHNYFFMEVLRGLQDRLADTEFDLLVHAAPTMDHVDAQLDRALQRGMAAGVLLFSTPLNDGRVARIQRSGRAVVLVDSAHPEFDCVSTDNVQGGCLATLHLIESGYERIGLIMANPESVPAADREVGYRKALRTAGLPFRPELVVSSQDGDPVGFVDLHGYTEAGGEAAMERLLALDEPPDAVFAVSDIQAIGALRAIEGAGLRAPDDIAVVGFDDIKLSAYAKLTTLQQPMYEMGRQSVDAILGRMRHKDRPISHTVFSPRLLQRATTGPRAAHAVPLHEGGDTDLR